MTQSISTYGLFLNDTRTIQRNQTNFDLLSFRVSSGQQFQSLRDYNNDASRLVTLRNEIDSREGYQRSIDLVSVVTDAYDTTLGQLSDLATDIIDAVNPLSTQEPNWPNTSRELADSFFLEIEANLNLQIGGRFIYAGTNYTDRPVVDMRSLNEYVAGDVNLGSADIEASLTAPFPLPQINYDDGGGAPEQSYHTAWAADGDNNEAASTRVSVTIADGQLQQYGLTATDPSFQLLVDSVLLLKSATQTGLTEDERDTFLTQAAIAAEDARDQIRQLQAVNGVTSKRINDAQENHQNFINISQTAIDDIATADTAQAAAELSALNNQIQASYSVISRRTSLSLVNFLR